MERQVVFRAGSGVSHELQLADASTKALSDAAVTLFGLASPDDAVFLTTDGSSRVAVSATEPLPDESPVLVAAVFAADVQKLPHLVEEVQSQCPELGDVSAQQQQPPEWSRGTECALCNATFDWSWMSLSGKARHHCRQCGQSVCQDCSPMSVPLPHFGSQYAGPQRVCNQCYRTLPSSTAPVLLEQDVALARTSCEQAERYFSLGQNMNQVAQRQLATVLGLNAALNSDANALRRETQDMARRVQDVEENLRMLGLEAAKDMQQDPACLDQSAIHIRYRSPDLTRHAQELSLVKDQLTKLRADAAEAEQSMEATATDLTGTVSDTAPFRLQVDELGASQGRLREAVQNHTLAAEKFATFVTAARGRMDAGRDQELEQCLTQTEREQCMQLRSGTITEHSLAQHELREMVTTSERLASDVSQTVNKSVRALAKVNAELEKIGFCRATAQRIFTSLQQWNATRQEIIRRLESQQKLQDGHLYQEQQRQIAQLQQQVDRLSHENTALRDGQACPDQTLIAENDRLKRDLTKLQGQASKVSVFEQQIQQLETEVARLRDANKVARTEVHGLTVENTRLAEQVAEASRQAQEHAAEATDLAAQNARLRAVETELRGEIDRLEGEGSHDETLQRSLSQSREAQQALQAQLDTLSAENAALRRAVQEAEAQRATVDDRIAASEAAATAHARQVAVTESALAQAQTQLAGYRERVLAAEENIIRFHEALVNIVEQVHPTGGVGIDFDFGATSNLPEAAVATTRDFVAQHGALRMELERQAQNTAARPARPQQVAEPVAQPVAQPEPQPVAQPEPQPQAAAAAAGAGEYADEIVQLRAMGFEDEAAMREALRESNGDVRLATNILIS